MDRIARFTQQWLDVFAGRELDWTREGDHRPLALDRAERAICHPGPFRVVGAARLELLRRRGVAERLLAEHDRRLADLVERRRALVARIEACDLAIAGTGILDRGPGPHRPQRLPGPRARPLEDPMPDGVGDGNPPLSGHPLRLAVVALLRALHRPLDLREIERLLRLEGIQVAGRASQTITNALRPALADRSIVRVGRGRYGAA